jgi:hypothetical protein
LEIRGTLLTALAAFIKSATSADLWCVVAQQASCSNRSCRSSRLTPPPAGASGMCAKGHGRGPLL